MYLTRIYFLIVLLPFIGGAQNFSAGFEAPINTEWSSTLGNGLPVFERNAVSKNTGAFGFQMRFNNTNQKGNLTSKNITWENGATYKISFKYRAIVPVDNSASNIKVFNGSGAKIMQYNFSLSNTSWQELSFDFTSGIDDASGSVLFSMRPSSTGTGEFYFDDFSIQKIEPDFFDLIKTIDVVSDSSIKWVQFGPGMSGNNNSLYTHPTDPDIVFSSPNLGNTYRSTDKGLTFETILNEDGPIHITGLRGAIEMYSLDFSRQNGDFGFCTGKRKGELYQSNDKGKSWTPLKGTPGISNNFLSCVAVDPSNDNVWFLGAGRMRDYGRLRYPQSAPKGTYLDPNANGRLWKSTDKGQTWTLSNSGINANAEFETIYVDPVNSSIVYAGSNYGFYKSTDGGTTWSLKSKGIDHDMIRSMALHHDQITGQVTIYALSNVIWQASGQTVADDAGGVFKSTDKGENWTKISTGLAINLDVFKNNQGVKRDYYISVAHYFGLSSTAAAEAQYPTLPSSITQRFNTITVDPNDVNNIYLINNYSNASVNNFKPGQIWRTKDGGASWFVTLRNGKNWNNGVDDSYWTSRGNPLGTNLSFKYKSDWFNRDDYERKGSNFVRFSADGSVVYTQMAKVGFTSYDKGDTWIDIDDEATGSNPNSWVGAGNSNLPGHGFYQTTSIPNKVFCPSGENSLWITNDEGDNVRPGAQGAEVMDLVQGEHSVSSIVVHPDDPTIWFATFFRQARRGQFLKSTDSGKTWNTIGTPLPLPWPEPANGGDQSVHQLSLLIDKDNPNNIYFCVPRSTLKLELVGDSVTGWGIHKSTDGGVTWTQPNTGLPASLDVSRLTFDPNSTSILYASVMDNGGGLYKSIDKGETWAEVATTTPISGSSGINDIHFDVDGKAYVTSGFRNVGANNGGLWVSEDDMQTWTKIFDFPWTNRVEVARYDTKTILLSTLGNSNIDFKNAGTYLSKDAGQSWIKINKGNGQSDRVNDIAIDYSTPGKYYASTRGSGWYAAIDSDPNLSVGDNTQKKKDIKVYPNPSKDTINIKGLSGEIELKIYSLQGQLVKEYKGLSSDTYSTSFLNQGIYLYELSNIDKSLVQTGKLVKR